MTAADQNTSSDACVFCSNHGYDSDSLKAFDTYRECMETGSKLRRALGSEYASQYERIQALRDKGEL